MAPDDAGARMLFDGVFYFADIEWLPPPDRTDIAVNGDGHIMLCRKVIERIERDAVGVGYITVGKRGQVVVAGHHLADALPQIRIPLQHPFDMLDGVAVVAVKPADKGMKALAIP